MLYSAKINRRHAICKFVKMNSFHRRESCHQMQRLSKISCTVPIQKPVPSCKHVVEVPSSNDVASPSFSYPTACEVKRPRAQNSLICGFLSATEARLYLKPRIASWSSLTWVSRMQVGDFVEPYLRQNNQSLQIHCFMTICLTKLVRVCERGMRLWCLRHFPANMPTCPSPKDLWYQEPQAFK